MTMTWRQAFDEAVSTFHHLQTEASADDIRRLTDYILRNSNCVEPPKPTPLAIGTALEGRADYIAAPVGTRVRKEPWCTVIDKREDGWYSGPVKLSTLVENWSDITRYVVA